jgi:crossover junction endodeoxyribonuclease RusA
MIRMTLPLPPSANRYWRHVKGRVLISKEAREYRQAVSMMAMGAMGRRKPIKGRYRMKLDIYRDLRGDLANHEKQLHDALEGTVVTNDRDCWELVMRRHLDRKNPRVEITIEPIEESA